MVIFLLLLWMTTFPVYFKRVRQLDSLVKMAPSKKKKKTKQELKLLAIARGKKAAQKRGKGVGSRLEMTLPSKWRHSTYKRGSEVRMKFTSPGKTVYKQHSEVKKTLKERDMSDCINEEIFASSSSSSEPDTDEFRGSSEESDHEQQGDDNLCVKMERRLFVCETTQLMDLVDQINQTSRCCTIDCNGILVLAKVEPTGHGGSLKALFVCNSCKLREVNFQGSAYVEGSKRTVVGLALGVAFFISGHGFAKFERTLRHFLGISCVSKNPYYDIIKKVYPVITEILDEQCNEAKDQMKAKELDELGSWKKAVVTSDGVWHTRGYFSKNGTFIIKNYMTGGLLWYGHKCMRGEDDVVEDDLYEGTSKSMEGVLADECYAQAKEEECDVNTVWQDADSSSAISVAAHHPNAKVFKCGGHVGRAHANNLKDMAKKKEFNIDYQKKYKDKFPLVSTRCHCKRHKKKCGCFSEDFIRNARINHFCILHQSVDAADYARRMTYLSKYHCRDIHKWKGGSCDFHPKRSCTCKKCDVDAEPKCEGKPYSTKCPLTCDFHWVAYQIECSRRADDAKSVIHPEMGRGHSNQCEAHFTVLPHFRAKSQSLNRPLSRKYVLVP
ncbi:uncharacterized protein LOC110234965 isoform X2 [Exaiptasia diaphana]|uniref:Uncharacterized protein n=1 Tax=Exaiptasia diaphana TaxID=2652724 RepID=A0A913YF33_EXADI|nr:uncharacterized protein LOC110234965 isoform X2 [Exaiptasia diaphana]